MTDETKPSSDRQSVSNLQDAIDTILQEAINSDRFLGLSFVALKRDGEVLYAGAHGSQTFNKDTPMELSTAGWMASMTKVMCSVAAMQCVERGLVGLDDDLSPIVPEFRDIEIITSYDEQTKTASFERPTEKITLRRLLNHSSGFAYDQWSPALEAWTKATGRDKDMGSGEWKAWIRPLAFNPGTSWLYGQGIDWAGRVVELLTAQSLEQYMQQNIWTPTGMTNTTFHPERRTHFPLLQLGRRPHGPNEPLTPSQSPWPVPVEAEMGGCGVYSSVEDYGKLLAALLPSDNGSSLLLSEKSIEEFIAPQLSPAAKDNLAAVRAKGLVQIDIPRDVPVDHALGGLVVLEDIPYRRSKGSMCWDGMSNPQWMLDRRSGIACALLTQILPCPDAALKSLWAELERTVYKYVGGAVGE